MAFSIHIWLYDSINTWFYFITQKSLGGIVNLGISKTFFFFFSSEIWKETAGSRVILGKDA